MSESVRNIKTIRHFPSSHSDFMLHYGHVPGFYEGWQDALAGSGFSQKYETAPRAWQFNYENARNMVIEMRSTGVEPFRWPERNRPGPHLWSSICRWYSRVWSAKLIEEGKRPIGVGEARRFLASRKEVA